MGVNYDTSNQCGDVQELRVLVGIASYGLKNIQCLERIVRRYEAMRFAVDVVVFSEAQKQLAVPAKVVVGLPTEDPWSLAFAHKPYFAKHLTEYDIFIYSEDDIDVSEENIDAFLELNRELPENEVAGFIRYESGANGEMSFPDFRDGFHWDPHSITRRGEETVAHFTNEHSAMYMLTRQQLKRAIESGGFLRPPYAGKYDMLCSAATDPYTSCGMKKVIGISRLRAFVVHHVTNRYAGEIGLPWRMLEQQVDAMLRIAKRDYPTTVLTHEMGTLDGLRGEKSYYEKPSEEILRLVAERPCRTALSIGCGWGETEVILKERGVSVTALPVDSIIGAVASSRGIEVILGSLDDGLAQVMDRRFDCVLLSNVLHLMPNGMSVIQRCAKLLPVGGRIIVGTSNRDYVPNRFRQAKFSDTNQSLSNRVSFPNGLWTASGVDGLTGANLVFDTVVWHGYRNRAIMSGAVHKPGTLRRFRSNLWHTIRTLGQKCDRFVSTICGGRIRIAAARYLLLGRWLATGCGVSLMRVR